MRAERGQAAIEWVALVLLAALGLGGLAAVSPRVDGRSFGGFIAYRLVCAVKGGCRDADAGLARAYGQRHAALLRRHAPGIVYEPGERSLPVDWRRCRRRACADAPDDRDLDAHRTDAGERATVFAHVVRRGGRTYLQYWLYYPDSNTTWAGSDHLWRASRWLPLARQALAGTPRYPGFHPDDWEGYVVRLEPDGSARARASSHGHWQSCKQRSCRGRWARQSGWTRVSRGSHAGHLPMGVRLDWRRLRLRRVPLFPGRDLRERTTTAEGLRLVPLRGLDRHRYRRLDPAISPPWQKEAYRRPESDSS